MADPLSEMIALLRPQASYSKLVEGSGAWRVRRTEIDQVYYCMLLTGRTRLEVDTKAPIELRADDFVLVPAASALTMSSLEPPPPDGLQTQPLPIEDGSVRLGSSEGRPKFKCSSDIAASVRPMPIFSSRSSRSSRSCGARAGWQT